MTAPSPTLSRARSLALIRAFRGKRILVLGDVMLDRYVRGNVSRISPEAPVQVVHVQKEEYSLGGSGNTARNIVALGGQASGIGVRGADAHGRELASQYRKAGMAPHNLVVDRTRPTTVKVRVVGHSQQLLRLDYESARPIDGSLQIALVRCLKREVPRSDLIVVSDYQKGTVTRETMTALMRFARRHRKAVVVDPKPANALLYKHVSLLTPNWSEARLMSGLDEAGAEDPHAVGVALRKRFGSSILITQGEKGMMLFERSNRGGRSTVAPVSIPTQAREVYDVTGAGDTVIATLALALAAGAGAIEAALLANAAAGVAVGRVGTTAVTAEDLIRATQDQP
ncbi:MAG: bifunctional hydroxymethylpyrimidine kinase/phosphomethylpyrimidine kinase [Nitrospirae bacterium]|nr:bifunctional hydroxymethylpyrimidine kinase/phosphomethylpyrimidine kinase [Nitrospirota bacterium]